MLQDSSPLSINTNDGIPCLNNDDKPAAVAADCCEVCLMAPCDATTALVPCRRQCFCQRSSHAGTWMSTVLQHQQ